MSSIFEDAGFTLPADTPAKGPVAAPAVAGNSPAPSQSIFSAAGFDVPTKSAPAPATVADNIPTPEKFAADYEKTKGTPAKSTLQQIREAISPADLGTTAAKNAYADTVEHFLGASHAVKEGYNEAHAGNLAPSLGAPEQKDITIPQISGNDVKTTQTVYPNASPGGILKMAGGLVGMPGAVVSGPTNALITRPVTELTGNPDIGNRAGIVANALIPTGAAQRVNEALTPSRVAIPTAAGVIPAQSALSSVARSANSLVSPSTKAIDIMVDAMEPENVVSNVARMRSNPRLTAADVSDPVRTYTQALVDPNQPGAQNIISNAIKNRIGSRTEATNTAFTQAMGPAPDVGAMVEGLKQRARQAGRQAIQPALENAKPVDVSPVIAAIDEKLKPGVNPLLDPGSKLPLSAEQEALARFKQQLTTGDGETLYDPQRLHRVQSDIGDQAFQLSKSADPKDRMLGSQLRTMNEKLIDQIDEASGGAYRPARQQFKDAKDIHQAFDEGFDVLKNRSGTSGFEDRPEALAQWMKTATPEEVVAKRLGVRADMDQKINGVKNGALAGQTVTAIPYNQQKLQTLFGDKEANRLIQVMRDSQDEATTNARILGNSKTAETLAAREALKVRDVTGGSPLTGVAPALGEVLGQAAGAHGGIGFLASLGLSGAKMGYQKVGQMTDRARNVEFARNALSTGSAREATMNALLSHPDVVRAAKKSANMGGTP
jgi:hypothetical protein